ncbi:MAG: PadR family transcriptional regulator [Anaerolineales bacterium]|nr:PadR family transcriptional regulator [Anaerolineales bacterium]
MINRQDDISSLLPLREPTFLILLSLADGEKHGYAILKDVSEISHGNVTMSTGTLYEALSRLLEQGIIERAANQPPSAAENYPGRPRKSYRLTTKGVRVVEAETMRIQSLVDIAQTRLSRS